MVADSTQYSSHLLWLWSVQSGEAPAESTWQGEIQQIQSGRRWTFATVDELRGLVCIAPGCYDAAMRTLAELLEEAAALHRHICPRQVLGVRMGMWAGELLGLDLPQSNKRLLTIVETDGCFADGVAVATNCWVGRRTMRVEDYGKVAATFADTKTGQAIRMAPHAESRRRAHSYAAETRNRWQAMLHGYQRMPVTELLVAQPVQLAKSVAEIISHAGRRVNCARCGEEIVNEREIVQDGVILCRSCAGDSYYCCTEPGAA